VSDKAFQPSGGVTVLFKDRLRELREKAGLTQEQLAAKAGVPIGSLRNHEQGQRQPSWSAVVKLSRALGVSTDVFAECDDSTKETDTKPAKKPTAKNGKGKK
jgi:transcriptional regulator with XRE-family HTH domain